MDLTATVAALDSAIEGLTCAVGMAGLDRAAPSVSAGCTDDALTDGLMAVARSSDRLAAVLTTVAGEWEARLAYALDGSRSAAARFARDTGCSPSTARALFRRARRLRTMPATAEAFGQGDVSVDKVDLLCRANACGRQTAFAEAEQRLVSDAKRLHYDDLASVIAYWISAADDAAAEDRAAKAVEDRYLNTSPTFEGSIDIAGRLDPINGAIFTGELERIERLLFDEDWAAARLQWGDAVTLDRLARTSGQRRADALVIMARRSSAMTPGSTPARPLFTVLIDQHTAKRTVCELANGTPITPGQAAKWVSEADFERMIFATPSKVIDVGRRDRLFRGATRRIIEVRDRHCTFPGCRVPAHLCDIDHITEWCNGGPTTQDNGRLRCPTHNRQRPGRTTPPRAGP